MFSFNFVDTDDFSWIYITLGGKTELRLIVFLFFLAHNAHNKCAVKTDSSLVFQKTWQIAIA